MPTVLEDYFDFSDPTEIRIQGHRVWLHHVLDEYRDGMTLEQLCERFHTLTKDKVLACLLYYHRNKEAMDKYMADLDAEFDRQRQESREEYGDWIGELRRRKAERDAQVGRESA